MQFSSLYLLATALISFSIAIPTSSRPQYVVHEKRERTHPAWRLSKRAAPEAFVPVRISLRQRNLDEGMRLFDDMTDFYSPNYGQWWTPEQIRDFFAPHQDDVEAVRAWLIDVGINPARISQSVNKQWVSFDGPIVELEALLDTQYYEYEHRSDGRVRAACEKYHVPAHLTQVIDYIMPGVNIGRSSTRKSRKYRNKRTIESVEPFSQPSTLLPRVASNQTDHSTDPMLSCGYAITPACIFAMYNITTGTTAIPGNEYAIFEAPIFPWNQSDLDKFFETLYPTIPAGTHPIVNAVDGASNGTGHVTPQTQPEASLDMQLAYPVIWPQNVVYFEVGDAYYDKNLKLFSQYNDIDDFLYSIDGAYCKDTSFGVGFNNTFDQPYPDPHKGGYKHPTQCGVFKAPNVFSTSYSGDELGINDNYSRRQCLEWMKLGMQGTSVLSASGDNGVDCDPWDSRIFNPDYLSSCPYVTSVGGTTIAPGASITDPQIATTNFGSGGGFSNIFPRPKYQHDAVEAYLTKYPPPFGSYSTVYNQSVGAGGGVYNRIGRAYPDLAAIAQSIAGWSGGIPRILDGTSAAAPLFGAMLTRINEARLQQGKSTVGFVNPILYAHSELLTDVTVGSNSNADSGCNVTSPGFTAAPGWDPVTGLGTPKFQAMLEFWTS